MTLPGVILSRQLADIEFIHIQFKCQPDKGMTEHYRSILASLCRTILTCNEFKKMLKNGDIYIQQINIIKDKVAEIEKDIKTKDDFTGGT